MHRRTVLAGAGLALASLAGCTGETSDTGHTETPEETSTPAQTPTPTETPSPDPGIDPKELDGFIRPDEDPQTVPEELVCDEEAFERRGGWIDEDELHWGNLTDENGSTIFALRVDTLAVERGETVTFTMTNVSAEEQETGNIYKSNFDVYTEAGWQDPRGWADGTPKPITDDLQVWDPGNQVELTFEMTEEGIIEGDYSPHEDDLVTCPGLTAGRYRFGTAAPEQGGVAIAFDLID